MHPHLQPVVNPYCKSNQPGCQGPTSDFRCLACDDRYHSNRRRYDRARIRQTRDSNLREEPADPDSGSTSPGSSVSSAVKDSPTASGPRFRPRTDPNTGNDADYDPRLRLPNPIPEQFPDDDPMLRGYIPLDDKLDLKASADPAFPPGSSLPAVCSPRPVPCALHPCGLWPHRRVIPKTYYPPTPAPSTKPTPLSTGGVPPGGRLRTETAMRSCSDTLLSDGKALCRFTLLVASWDSGRPCGCLPGPGGAAVDRPAGSRASGRTGAEPRARRVRRR